MIAPPTSRIVAVWPMPQSTPVRAARASERCCDDDRRHGHDVIGIGRVPHAEQEAEHQHGAARAVDASPPEES